MTQNLKAEVYNEVTNQTKFWVLNGGECPKLTYEIMRTTFCINLCGMIGCVLWIGFLYYHRYSWRPWIESHDPIILIAMFCYVSMVGAVIGFIAFGYFLIEVIFSPSVVVIRYLENNKYR